MKSVSIINKIVDKMSGVDLNALGARVSKTLNIWKDLVKEGTKELPQNFRLNWEDDIEGELREKLVALLQNVEPKIRLAGVCKDGPAPFLAMALYTDLRVWISTDGKLVTQSKYAKNKRAVRYCFLSLMVYTPEESEDVMIFDNYEVTVSKEDFIRKIFCIFTL
jgi:hypothetical protein